MSTNVKRTLASLPIPTLIVVILALHLVVKPSRFYEPPWLLPITNAVFVTVVCLIVAYIAMRNYRATGRIQILLLGCGLLAFGIGGVVAGFVRSIPGTGANLNVTIYNTGAFIGAVFHFAAALILLADISPEVGSQRREFWLVFCYVGLIVFMILLTIVSLVGSIPPFFIQGVGPTPLRQWVLGFADILFAFSFLIFMTSYLKSKEVFLYWYSAALALTSISLTAFFVESAVGSPIGWAGRFSQYLGGIYFLVAVLTAMRSATARRTSFDNVLTVSLSPAEEEFRALAENSPDVIERFDKEMRRIYVNQAGLELFGKPAGSIMRKKVGEVELTDPHVSVLKERIQRVFETAQPMEMERYIPTGNGTKYYQSHCVPEFGVDGTVKHVLVVSRDLTERKRAEEALRESEQRYRSLFNGMTEGFALHEILTDAQGQPVDYRFVDVNPAFERLTGLKRPDLMDRCVTEVLPGIEDYWIEKYGRVALTGEATRFENFSAALGKWYNVLAYQSAPRQFAVVFLDVTERRRTEEALHRSEERFRAIASSTPDHVLVQDRNLRYTMVVNPQLGLGEQDMIGKTDFDVLVKEDAEKLTPIKRKVLETGKPVYVETPVISRDGKQEFFEGSYVPKFDTEGRCDGLIGYFRNVTERKHAEEALQESRERLGADLDAMTRLQKVGTLFASEGCLQSVLGEIVDAAIAISGADFGNIQVLDPKTSCLQIVGQRGFPEWWIDFWNRVAEGQGACGTALERGGRVVVENVEQSPIFVGTPALEIQLKAGVRAVQSTPLVSRSGKPLGMFSTHYKTPRRPDDRVLRLLDLLGRQAADIIERARNEEELHRSRDELELRVKERTADLEKANVRLASYNKRLEALNKELQDFAFIASHDLQEPLRKIVTFGNVLTEKYGASLDETSRDYLGRMQNAARRMRNLLASLLEYSRVTTKFAPMKQTEIRRSVEGALANLEILIKENNARIEVGDLPTVWADRIQMMQLFQNLIGNAVKFHRPGEAPRVKVYARLRDENGAYEICVEDNGIGFEKRYLDQVFLPFQRLHGGSSGYEGVGMGLAICKKIVERHGGEITATSELGKGSTFIVRLPRERKVG